MNNKNKVTMLALIIFGIIFLNLFVIELFSYDPSTNDLLIESEGKEKIKPSNLIYFFKSLICDQKYKVYVEELPPGIDNKNKDVIEESFEFWEEVEKIEFEVTENKNELLCQS